MRRGMMSSITLDVFYFPENSSSWCYSNLDDYNSVSKLPKIINGKLVVAHSSSNVTDMANMFQGCSALTTIPQLDTSNVTNMSFMFIDCTSLTTIPQLNTSNVTNMANMFIGCTSLTGNIYLDLSSCTNCRYLLLGVKSAFFYLKNVPTGLNLSYIGGTNYTVVNNTYM